MKMYNSSSIGSTLKPISIFFTSLYCESWFKILLSIREALGLNLGSRDTGNREVFASCRLSRGKLRASTSKHYDRSLPYPYLLLNNVKCDDILGY
jgi:hypothetical protein